MENKEFRKIINDLAQKNGFQTVHRTWLKESDECIIVLYLQKSNFGNYYYLNINIYIQDAYDKHYSANENLVKKYFANLSRGQPKEYLAIFDLEFQLNDHERKQKLEEFFIDFLIPFCNKALSRTGIKELGETSQILVPEKTQRELEKLEIK